MCNVCLRSAYFHQIEEDVVNHAKTIKEIKTAIASFQTSNMSELVKFHKYIESHLEKLTDECQVHIYISALFIFPPLYYILYIFYYIGRRWLESFLLQVLARFEDFPFKKLEALRTAATLYSKLDSIVCTLQSWQPASPVSQHLARAERYFNKVETKIPGPQNLHDSPPILISL